MREIRIKVGFSYIVQYLKNNLDILFRLIVPSLNVATTRFEHLLGEPLSMTLSPILLYPKKFDAPQAERRAKPKRRYSLLTFFAQSQFQEIGLLNKTGKKVGYL